MYLYCSYCLAYVYYKYPDSLSKCNNCYKSKYIKKKQIDNNKKECKCDPKGFINNCNLCYKQTQINNKNHYAKNDYVKNYYVNKY